MRFKLGETYSCSPPNELGTATVEEVLDDARSAVIRFSATDETKSVLYAEFVVSGQWRLSPTT